MNLLEYRGDIMVLDGQYQTHAAKAAPFNHSTTGGGNSLFPRSRYIRPTKFALKAMLDIKIELTIPRQSVASGGTEFEKSRHNLIRCLPCPPWNASRMLLK
jgi:hypothetical protein